MAGPLGSARNVRGPAPTTQYPAPLIWRAGTKAANTGENGAGERTRDWDVGGVGTGVLGETSGYTRSGVSARDGRSREGDTAGTHLGGTGAVPAPGATGGKGFGGIGGLAGGDNFHGYKVGDPIPGTPGTTGTQSGPGILEQWFNQRATGSDPAFDYMSKRGMRDLGTRYAAGGAFNSGAARQGESDMMANLISQRMGQLDSLAGGASGEHQGRLNSMFGQGLGLAGGEAGTMGAYDLKAGDSLNAANQAILSMYLGKAGVDDKSRQGGMNNLIGLGSLFA